MPCVPQPTVKLVLVTEIILNPCMFGPIPGALTDVELGVILSAGDHTPFRAPIIALTFKVDALPCIQLGT